MSFIASVRLAAANTISSCALAATENSRKQAISRKRNNRQVLSGPDGFKAAQYVVAFSGRQCAAVQDRARNGGEKRGITSAQPCKADQPVDRGRFLHPTERQVRRDD